MEEKDVRIQRDLGAVQASLSTGTRMLKLRTGLNYGRKGVKELMEERKLLSDDDYQKEMSDAKSGSAGEIFVETLKSDPDVIAIFLFDDGGKLDLIKLKKEFKI